jgi:two-component system nitrogen regulation response regulator NtrX
MGKRMDKKIKLMVMDDESSIVEYITKIFKIKGYDTFGASNAKQALETFQKYQPDICILDVFLVDSELDGVDVLEKIRKVNQDAVCIMFSRITDDEKIKKANELGIFEFLFKPLDPQKLKEVVAEAVKQVKQKGSIDGE